MRSWIQDLVLIRAKLVLISPPYFSKPQWPPWKYRIQEYWIIFSCHFKETAPNGIICSISSITATTSITWPERLDKIISMKFQSKSWNAKTILKKSWFCWKVQNCCLLTDSQNQVLNSKSCIRSPTNDNIWEMYFLYTTVLTQKLKKYKRQYLRNAHFVHKNTEYFFQKNTSWKHTLELKSFMNHICLMKI